MVPFAERLRDVLIPALVLAGAAVGVLLVVVVVQRLVRDAVAWRTARNRARYAPLLGEALDASGPARERAMSALGAAPRRHRAVVADVLVEPLRVVRGAVVDRARAVARELGWLDEWRAGLARGSSAARSKAALALGLVRDAEAVPALIGLLDHGSDQVRAAAVDALGMIGDGAAVEVLLGRLGSSRATSRLGSSRRSAAWARPSPGPS